MLSLFARSDLDEGAALGLEVNNHYLFAIKKAGKIYLYWNCCPHLGTPLEWLENQFLDADGALIQCSTHGALFQIENGHCLSGPCRGKYLQKVPFTILNDQIIVEDSLLKPPVLA